MFAMGMLQVWCLLKKGKKHRPFTPKLSIYSIWLSWFLKKKSISWFDLSIKITSCWRNQNYHHISSKHATFRFINRVKDNYSFMFNRFMKNVKPEGSWSFPLAPREMKIITDSLEHYGLNWPYNLFLI